MSVTNELINLATFYELIDRLYKGLDGGLRLKDVNRACALPARGVYFFFEDGETRTPPLSGPRVVRVGTHGLKIGSKSTLYARLAQHRGTSSGDGNHRGSVFRLHAGKALLNRDASIYTCPTWARGNTANSNIREGERFLEQAVSQYLGNMNLLWLNVADDSGPLSERGFI
jgi:hypothetical protein